jgi:serine/threonine protein kinase
MNFGVSGKYRLDRRLGGGGMAEVFAGSMRGAEGFSRKVAIKRVLPGLSENPGFAQMFVAEAQISSRLIHPNIVSVLDFDRDADRRLFLVMELVDGKDLAALIETGVLPVPVVIFVISEVLRGLGFAHDLPIGTGMRGVVHRDVSPHNVLLSWEGAVKISDFGIAKARAASEATASAFIKGKPAYMSPEQANGQPLDGRSDLFAAGIMLWEMLVGHRLFVADDTRATLARVLFGAIARPRSIRPEVPKDVERVAMKLLERDLPGRYATGEAAIADLLECADAPRGGREALIAILLERFPTSAPVRHSAARGRAASPTPPPGSVVRPTIPDSAGGPVATVAATRVVAASPGLGTLREAPTRTLQRPAQPWVTQAAIVVAVMLGCGVAAFAIVSAAKRKPTTRPHSGAAGPALTRDRFAAAATPRPGGPGALAGNPSTGEPPSMADIETTKSRRTLSVPRIKRLLSPGPMMPLKNRAP